MSDRETDVYLYLVKSEPQPASRIAHDLHLHKAQVYHLLKTLQRKGVVVSTLEKPARFAVIPFDELLDLHIKNREEEVNDLKSHRRANLLTQWRALARGTQRSHLEHYVVFQGRERFYTKVRQMEKEARDEIVSVNDVGAFLPAERYGVFDYIHVPNRIIVEVTKDNVEALRHVRSLIGPLFELRHHPVARSVRFIMRDRDEVLILVRSHAPDPRYGSGFCSTSTALVTAFHVLFDELWHDAIDVDAKIATLDTAQPVRGTSVE